MDAGYGKRQAGGGGELLKSLLMSYEVRQMHKHVFDKLTIRLVDDSYSEGGVAVVWHRLAWAPHCP
jgi:hypothetical protein